MDSKVNDSKYVGARVLFATLWGKLSEKRPDLDQLMIVEISGMPDVTAVSKWKNHGLMPKDIFKLKALCVEAGMSLEDACDILEGKTPPHLQRFANIISYRKKRRKWSSSNE